MRIALLFPDARIFKHKVFAGRTIRDLNLALSVLKLSVYDSSIIGQQVCSNLLYSNHSVQMYIMSAQLWLLYYFSLFILIAEPFLKLFILFSVWVQMDRKINSISWSSKVASILFSAPRFFHHAFSFANVFFVSCNRRCENVLGKSLAGVRFDANFSSADFAAFASPPPPACEGPNSYCSREVTKESTL